ncbi:golgin subfamily B member 1 isoform X1 [Stomoxys calcitrans]|uniref:golgin subfamily B member 1 isoform X1 n=1 Tax=Stomoxys calcitrans TaxID=35570 RepID=UPI0027E21D34|nr:golgin subfamily B member 1 isoform X1 [Stomoxys calcitrans]
MDMRSWKKVLLQWITECGFMERNYFNIEQSDIDVFYQNFSSQHPKTSNGKYKRISDFLKEFYPQFEAHQDDENCLSSSDYIYIYSILLHFSCVKHPHTIFHEICQRLPIHDQQCIASFFKELLDVESPDKETLRHAIGHVVSTHVTPPRQRNDSFSSNQSVSSGVSVGGMGSGSGGSGGSVAGSLISNSLLSPGIGRCDSPLKTPKRCAGTQRISPTTPKSNLLEERTRELFNLRAQLETERYEKGLLEVQIKQNEDKILKLNQDNKKLLHQIQDLKNDLLVSTSDYSSSTNEDDAKSQLQKRLLKEISAKEDEIFKLNDIGRTLREEKSLIQEKLSYAEKQIVICMSRITELEFKIEELNEEIEKKNNTIKYLTDNKMELEQFINENRLGNTNSDLNGSMECFDGSFARNIGNNNASSNLSSPENLGASVIDIQLREKEHENSKLKEELEMVKDEHKRLAKNLQELAEKQAKEFDIVLEQSIYVESESEMSPEESSIQSDPLGQLSLFSNCMEKITSYHKMEKKRIQELEAENADLSLQVADGNEEILRLKTKVNERETENKALLEAMHKCHLELDQLLVQKQDLYIELQNTMALKDGLSDSLESLKEKMDLSAKTHQELSQSNSLLQTQLDELLVQQKDLIANSNRLEFDYKELQMKSLQETQEYEMHLKTLEVAMENLESDRNTLKMQYEELVKEHGELTTEARKADDHLLEMKNLLQEKQQAIEKLGNEITEFTKKNQKLEEKINTTMQEFEQEKYNHEVAQSNSQEEIKALEDEKEKLQKDIENSSALNKALEEKMSLLMHDYEQEKLKHENSREKVLSLEETLQKMQQEYQRETEKQQQEISASMQKNQNLFEQIENMKLVAMQEKQALESLQTLHHEEVKSLGDNFNKLRIEKQEENEKLLLDIRELSNKNKTLEIQWEQERLNYESLKTQHQREIEKLAEEYTSLQCMLEETKELLNLKTQESNERQQLLADLYMKIKQILQLFETDSIQQDSLENIKNLEQEVKKLLQQNSDLTMQLKALEMTQNHDSKRMQQLLNELDESNMKITNLQSTFAQINEKAKTEQQELVEKMQQASKEYENSLEAMRSELTLEKEHHTTKERELLLVIAQHNEVKKLLNEKELEIEKLMETLTVVQEQNKKLKLYESRITECSQENNHLQQEIESFKQQVHQNAMRLLEADKALSELFDITKEQESIKKENWSLQETLSEKENALQSALEIQQDLERQLQEQSEAIDRLSETLAKFEQRKDTLDKQIQREQEEKALLIESLEKQADQLKSLEDDSKQQKTSMQEKYSELKQQLEELTVQNTKLQGDLLEREAELRMSLEDREQEREGFEQELNLLRKQMSETSEQLENFDMALMEILVIMENNFNLKHELQQQVEVKNFFNTTTDCNEQDHKLNNLRGNLNLILHLDKQIRTQLKELNLKHNEALATLESTLKTNSNLQAKIAQQEKQLTELREQVENDEIIAEKRVSQEILRLEEDLLNLEKVNERLTHGNLQLQETMSIQEKDLKMANAKLHKLEEEKLMLKEEICTKTTLLEKLQQEEKSLQQLIKEKTQTQEKIMEKCKLLECQLKEKSTKLQHLDKQSGEFKEKLHKEEKKNEELRLELKSQQTEQAKLQEKLKLVQAANDSLETEVSNKTKELLGMNHRISELLQSLKNIEQQLQVTTRKLDESETLKLNSESSLQQMHSDAQQLRRDIDFLRAQQQTASEENNRLGKEIESLKQDKQHLREEIRDTKSDLQRANDNVTQLIQQISSIRLEKEAVVEENSLLRKQLDETGKHHSSSENKLKFIVEKSQDLERKLLAAENELKSVKATLEKREATAHKLTAENKKLKESQENATKRIEKLALKLGDSQAKGTKLERDNEKLAKTLEANATTLDALQKEKDILQNEAKALKERLSRAERAHENLATKVQNLEQINAELQETKQKLEASEIDGKTKLNKLEKMRQSNEEKMRKLANSLNNAENENVKLNLEIGSLNSELQEARGQAQHNNQERLLELANKLELSQQECTHHQELNEQLQQELEQLKDDKLNLSDQLSKVNLALQITKQHCEKLCSEMEDIRTELLAMRDEKSQFETQHETSSLKLKDLEIQNDHLLHEHKNLVTTLESRIATLEENLGSKCQEVEVLQQEIQTLRDNSESHSAVLQQAATISETELQQLRMKISQTDEFLQKEQQITAQLRLDNQILHTKYQESKQRALDATKNSEERIKENRLELEGKLEKMKNKMKTLYTEEITKMKTKQERELAVIKSEMEILKNQNIKYEEHTRKLSHQIVRLNENILEYQKENAILSTKFKHLMETQDNEKFKRPSSIHVSTISSSTGPSAASNTGTNLAMEDEEGEVFNNTYLTDLKTGRMSEYMSREVCAEELKYRNSLLPPHLRSAYAAQYESEIGEDELKDGPHSFDDSMSALLSTTAGGTRKKCSGVTHYKRPGPPTPSKNGRLSFGGISTNSEPAREILKESFDSGANAVAAVSSSSSKTPARFNFFASRFSMGNATKDEKPLNKPNVDEEHFKKDKQKLAVTKAAINRRLLGGVVCTSTPRKSKLHYDQRRLLDQLLTSSPSPSPLTLDNKAVKLAKKITPPDVSYIETPVTALVYQHSPTIIKAPSRKQPTKRIEAIATGLKNKRRNSWIYGRRLSRRVEEICTPTSGETTSSAFSNTPKNKARRQTIGSATTTTSGGRVSHKTVILQKRLTKKKPAKERNARPSLHLKGGIFIKYRTHCHKGIQQNQMRCKSRKQRLDHFNQARDLRSFQDIVSPEGQNLTFDISCNNNYATFNRNKLGQTVILKDVKQEEEELTEVENESFVSGSEVFACHTQDAIDCYPYNVCEYDTDEASDIKTDEQEDSLSKEEKNNIKKELITSFDLEQFDRYVSVVAKASKSKDSTTTYASNGSSEQFEKLVLETESSAPFEVKRIQFNVTGSSQSSYMPQSQETRQILLTTNSNVTPSPIDLREGPTHHNVIVDSPPLHNFSPNSNPGNLSRIIYGGTVIYNRRLPNINTTYVRKSSIYIQNKNHNLSCDSMAGNDVILITNQTITVADLARMWKQMDSSARLIVSFAALASFTTLLGLFLSFYAKN